MNVPFAGLCAAELRKVRGRGLLYATLLFGAMHGVVAPLLARLTVLAGDAALQGAGQQPGLGAQQSDSLDWLVAADLSLSAAAFPINGLVVLFLMAILWSQDFSLGTMAMLIVRPVSRLKIFLSKVAVSWGIVAVALLLATAFGALLGLPLFGVSGDVAGLAGVEVCMPWQESPCFPYISWMAELPDGELAAGAAAKPVALGAFARIGGIAQGFFLALLLFGPIIGVTSLVATLTRSPVLTLFGSLFVLLADSMVASLLFVWGGLESVGGSQVAAKLFEWTIWANREFYFLHGSGELFARGWQEMVLTALYTAGFLGLSAWLFIKRDVN